MSDCGMTVIKGSGVSYAPQVFTLQHSLCLTHQDVVLPQAKALLRVKLVKTTHDTKLTQQTQHTTAARRSGTLLLSVGGTLQTLSYSCLMHVRLMFVSASSILHLGSVRAIIIQALFSILCEIFSKCGGVLSQFVKFNSPGKNVKRYIIALTI